MDAWKRIVRNTIVAFVAIVILCVPIQNANAQAGGFPAYHGQPLHTEMGTFREFDNGNHAGGVIIAINGKQQLFRSAKGLTFNGRHISCFANPTPGNRYSACADWPRGIVPGSRVRVTYWIDKSDDSPTDRVAKDVSAAGR